MEAATATPFSLELTQDQQDIRDWVHGFAEQVVRPAAAEWVGSLRRPVDPSRAAR